MFQACQTWKRLTRLLPLFALISCSGNPAAPEVEPSAGGPADLAQTARAIMDKLDQEPESAELQMEFLAVFEMVADEDRATVTPETSSLFGRAFQTVQTLALAGHVEFLQALMVAGTRAYGRTAEGAEWINEMLWENLQEGPRLTLDALAALPEPLRQEIVDKEYTAPAHDGFDFSAILAGLEDTEVPADLASEVEKILSTVRPLVSFHYTRRIGLVQIRPGGEACLTIKDADLHPGTTVAVIRVSDGGSRLLSGEIAASQKTECDPAGAERRDSTYKVIMPTENVDHNEVYLAVVHPRNRFRTTDSQVTVDLDEDGTLENFRVCTSNEGLHFTVWSGEPLVGNRRWHRYHYLGFDVVPDCAEADYATN